MINIATSVFRVPDVGGFSIISRMIILVSSIRFVGL